MENPEQDIEQVIKALTQGSANEQYQAVQRYYQPSASFVHPFCAVPHIGDVELPGLGTVNSRTLILAIYKWYRILSPKIEIQVNSTVFDKKANKLYADVSQVFALWFVPFYRAPVHFTVVLHLEKSDGSANRTSSHNGHSLTNHVDHDGEEGPSYAAVAAAPPGSNPAVENGPPGPPSPTTNGTNGTNRSHHSEPEPTRYRITKQEDLYQVNEFLKFLLPGIGAPVWATWQLLSTTLCTLGVLAFWPVLVLLGMTGLAPVQARKSVKDA